MIQLSLASTLPQTPLCICWPRFDFSSMKEITNQEIGCKRNDSDLQLMIFQAIFVLLVHSCAQALDRVLLVLTIFAWFGGCNFFVFLGETICLFKQLFQSVPNLTENDGLSRQLFSRAFIVGQACLQLVEKSGNNYSHLLPLSTPYISISHSNRLVVCTALIIVKLKTW